jgi:hypothetical protein
MDAPISCRELGDAIRDVVLVRSQTFSDPNALWDHAISVLVIAREQHGGEIRRLLTALLTADSGRRREQVAADLDGRLQAGGRGTSDNEVKPTQDKAQLGLFEPEQVATRPQ